MKKVLHRIKACIPYFIFIFFIILFFSALSKSADKFRFRNGEELSQDQRLVVIFVMFLLAIISGYGAFKRAQADWRFWKKRSPESKK